MALVLFCYHAAHLRATGPHVEHVAGRGAVVPSFLVSL